MAHQPAPAPRPSPRRVTIEQLTATQYVQPMSSTDDWAADIFQSDEELDAFLADMRASRDAFLA